MSEITNGTEFGEWAASYGFETVAMMMQNDGSTDGGAGIIPPTPQQPAPSPDLLPVKEEPKSEHDQAMQMAISLAVERAMEGQNQIIRELQQQNQALQQQNQAATATM